MLFILMKKYFDFIIAKLNALTINKKDKNFKLYLDCFNIYSLIIKELELVEKDFILTYILLDRIKDNIVINNNNRMIILIILLRIEDKVENDIIFSNKDWSEIFEISLFIFNYYEYKMLELFNFNINFKLEEYIKYKKRIDYLLN